MRFLGLWFIAGVVALVAYVGAPPLDMHVDRTPPPRPRHDATCVTIELDNQADRHILDHAWDAIAKGAPRRLHIDRAGADGNREESLRGIPTRPGYDRDEYPPAVSAEGGAGADVRYVASAENRRAGNEMGQQLRGYDDGQCFQYERRPQ